jgi:hypothetical protein
MPTVKKSGNNTYQIHPETRQEAGQQHKQGTQQGQGSDNEGQKVSKSAGVVRTKDQNNIR